jgi:hypothetical protein
LATTGRASVRKKVLPGKQKCTGRRGKKGVGEMSPAEAYSRSCSEAGIEAEPVVAAALAEMSGRLVLSGVILVRAS